MELINYRYAAGCQEDGRSTAPPDCGHDCGVLCDVLLLSQRPDGALSDLRANYHNGKSRDRSTKATEVRELLRRGMTLPEIAAELGVPLSLVVLPLKRDCTGNTANQYVEVERLLRQGNLSFGAIAKLTDVDRNEVRTLAGTIGVKSGANERNQKYTAEQREKARRLLQEGHSRRQIAELTGVDYETVKKWLRATDVDRSGKLRRAAS